MLIDSAHRRWLIGTTIAAALATVGYVPYYRGAINGPSGGSVVGLVYGIAAFACMLVVGLLGARRKVPTWRIGRAATWMKGHIWLGLLTLPLVLFHGGFAFGGPLTTVLMVLLCAVLASGIYGLVLQQFLPRVMRRSAARDRVRGDRLASPAPRGSRRPHRDRMRTAVADLRLPRGRRAGGEAARRATDPRARDRPPVALCREPTPSRAIRRRNPRLLSSSCPQRAPSTPAKAGALFRHVAPRCHHRCTIP